MYGFFILQQKLLSLYSEQKHLDYFFILFVSIAKRPKD